MQKTKASSTRAYVRGRARSHHDRNPRRAGHHVRSACSALAALHVESVKSGALGEPADEGRLCLPPTWRRRCAPTSAGTLAGDYTIGTGDLGSNHDCADDDAGGTPPSPARQEDSGRSRRVAVEAASDQSAIRSARGRHRRDHQRRRRRPHFHDHACLGGKRCESGNPSCKCSPEVKSCASSRSRSRPRRAHGVRGHAACSSLPARWCLCPGPRDT